MGQGLPGKVARTGSRSLRSLAGAAVVAIVLTTFLYVASYFYLPPPPPSASLISLFAFISFAVVLLARSILRRLFPRNKPQKSAPSTKTRTAR